MPAKTSGSVLSSALVTNSSLDTNHEKSPSSDSGDSPLSVHGGYCEQIVVGKKKNVVVGGKNGRGYVSARA